jgi:glyoxylase-like metal-dependent hydrolase (beta-lactamase superfamily II)
MLAGVFYLSKSIRRRCAVQITEHIHALKIPFQVPVGPGKSLERFVYIYLILGPGICLIDSGVKNTDVLIWDYLKKLGRKPRDISLLILTHAHPDHIGASRAIKEATNCSVAAHPDAQAWIEDVEQQFKERPVPGFHDLVGGSTAVDRLLRGREVIALGPVSLKVIHTPGHARGSISLYCKEEGALFSGDAILQANDLPIYEDAVTTAASIRKLKDIKPIEYLLSSWTDPLAGSSAYKMMNDGLDYLQRIHYVIRDMAAKAGAVDPMELCARVVKILGLPEVAVNPLIAQSFVSHMKIIGRDKLL